MIEEMDEAGELRSRLLWIEHDLEHVVAERDQAIAKVNAVWEVVNQYFGDPLNWDKPMDGPSVMVRVRKALLTHSGSCGKLKP